MSGARPSGATLFVVKKFEVAEEFLRQFKRMANVAGAVPVSLTPKEYGYAFQMPLCRPLPPNNHAGVRACLERIWATPHDERVSPTTSLEEYALWYVAGRLQRVDADSVVASGTFKQTLARLYSKAVAALAAEPPRQPVTVHGDATMSNFVVLGREVLAIDLSPREVPGHRELDVAKLAFSSFGFDMQEPYASRLRDRIMREWIDDFELDPDLFNFYLASHVVRVASREPQHEHVYTRILDSLL